MRIIGTWTTRIYDADGYLVRVVERDVIRAEYPMDTASGEVWCKLEMDG